MRFITWNCNGALRNKLNKADSFNADLLIIQECENPAQSSKEYEEWAGNYLWLGTNKNKGVGIFPKNGHTVKRLYWSGEFRIQGLNTSSASASWNTEDLQLFLPFRFNDKLNFLGCWTKGSDSQAFGYMGQFWKYLQIHREQLNQQNTIIAGDFNSNAIWDKQDRWWSHTDTINELSAIGIESLYHHQTGENQGQESQPTFYLHRNETKSYHIDYVFMSKKLLAKTNLEIGKIGDWLSVSDHMPICVTFED